MMDKAGLVDHCYHHHAPDLGSLDPHLPDDGVAADILHLGPLPGQAHKMVSILAPITVIIIHHDLPYLPFHIYLSFLCLGRCWPISQKDLLPELARPWVLSYSGPSFPTFLIYTIHMYLHVLEGIVDQSFH